MAFENQREEFLVLYEQLKHEEKILARIERMVSYREPRLDAIPMTMREKVQYMKESNIIAIVNFMNKIFKKQVKKWISNCDLTFINLPHE